MPYSGTYLVEVSADYDYTSEYRFRVTEASSAVQFASKYDDSVSNNPNTPTLTNTSPGNLTAQIGGYIGQGDVNGDYYSLGNVLPGTTINLTLTQTANSTLGSVLNIYNSAGTNLTNNLVAGNSLSYTVPAGQGGTYYARVSSASVTTVSFWMDWNGSNNSGNGEVPISFANYCLYLHNGYFGFDTNGDVYGISSTGLANGWHMVTAVFGDGSYAQDQLWIDGVQQTLSEQGSPAGTIPLVSTAISIGGLVNNTNYDFTGSLDEVAYFDKQLTPAQIQAEYAAQNSGNYSTVIQSQSPAAYYPLQESSGTIAYDASGNYNNGSFGSGITVGVAGALNNHSDSAYQFAGGQITATIPASTGLLSQYVLAIDVANTTPPQITGNTLPASGTTSSAVINSFGLSFSEDMNAATVNNTANYTLQDGLGNVYHLTSPGYTSGSTANYVLSDGPLQPGSYTLTVSGLTDRTGNVLATYVRQFTVVGVAPYTLVSRASNTPASATPLVTPSSQSDGSFTPATSTSVSGSQPYDVVSSSLRGAGHPLDLVTANYNSGTISVLLGNGDGTFQPAVTYTVGSNPIALALGDLTGNGILDIAVANYGSGTISVLLGNGDGTFQPAVTYNVGSNPRGIAIANLNGSANGNDLVASNYGSNNVSVLLNNGNGTFATAVNYNVGCNPTGLAIADLNGDGNLDIAVANYGSSTVSVLSGNGNGTFGTAVNFNVGSNPYDVVAANFTGGSALDLATANYGSNNVSILLNQGTPALLAEQHLRQRGQLRQRRQQSLQPDRRRPEWQRHHRPGRGQLRQQSGGCATGQRQRHLPNGPELLRQQQPRQFDRRHLHRQRPHRPGYRQLLRQQRHGAAGQCRQAAAGRYGHGPRVGLWPGQPGDFVIGGVLQLDGPGGRCGTTGVGDSR